MSSSWWPFGNNKQDEPSDVAADHQPLTTARESSKPQQQQHPLYGTTITIESPATTPKTSHVKHAPVEQEAIQRLAKQRAVEHSDSMPDRLDTASAENNHHSHPSPKSPWAQANNNNNVRGSGSWIDKDDYSLPSTDYSDIRPALLSTKRQWRGMDTESLRSAANSVQSSLVHSIELAVDATFVLPGQPSSVRDAGGTASISNEIFNLIKNIVGAGAFGLPRGVAAFANAPSALYPATVCTIAMGAIFGYYFWLMGRICHLTLTASYREAWDETVGKSGSGGLDDDDNDGMTSSGIMGAIVPLFIILMAGLGNLAYNMILADTTRSLLARVGVDVTRSQCLWATIGLVLLPLCMVKRLSVLAPFSLVGLMGMVITIGVIVARYYDGSYEVPTWEEEEFANTTTTTTSTDGATSYLDHVPPSLQPLFGTVGAMGALSGNFLILACMNFQGFFCHYNAPRYYIELENNTIERFTRVVVVSFGVCMVLYVVLMTYGFLTFGEHSDGFLLNNYADDDNLISMCRLLIAIALAFTYPLPFIGVRDGILDLLMVPANKRTSNNLNVLTLVLLAVFGGLATQFTDVGMVNAVGGGALGTAVVFIFPALMFRNVVQDLGLYAPLRMRRESSFAYGLMWAGIAMGGIGVYMGIKES